MQNEKSVTVVSEVAKKSPTPFVKYSRVTTAVMRTQMSTFEREFTELSDSDPTDFATYVMREHEMWSVYEERTWTTTFDKAASTWTYQTPEARTSVVTLNPAGRVAQRQWPGMAAITYAYYDAPDLHAGRLQSITQSART